MKQRTATRKRSAAGGVVRSGRPPRDLAGAVEERILDAAAKVVGLIRAAVAEARRFPDLAASVSRMAIEQVTEAVAHLLGELAEPDKLPAFAADRRAATARHFLDLILLPMLMCALFGERLTALRAEIAPHVARTVAFFLAACRQGGIG